MSHSLAAAWISLGLMAAQPAPQGISPPTALFPADLSTPRSALESFSFAAEGIRRNVRGSMIAAITMCDFPEGARPDEVRTLVAMLIESLDIISPPFVRATTGTTGDTSLIYSKDGHRVSLSRGADGKWRFDRATIMGVPALHQDLIRNWKQFEADRGKLVEGLGDPTQLFETFFKRLLAQDYESAAQCLDLSLLPPENRKAEGTRLAWMLGLAIQRVGFVFSQDIPVDPSRPPYLWYAGLEGFVVAERVESEGQQDRWAFSAICVGQIEELYAKVKDRPVDPRWTTLGMVIAPLEKTANQKAPPELDRNVSSPRYLLQAFLRAIDEAEHDDTYLEKAAEMLDLSYLPADEARRVGPRLAEKLEVLLRKIKPVLADIDDRWSSPPVTLADKQLRIRISRRPDGRWCFDRESVLRIQAMYDSLTSAERGPAELSAGRSSPRETFVTFLRAMNDNHLSAAAQCLDLSDIPVSARANLGPVLAAKLKLVIDRVGRVYFHEIPSETDGPRYLWHRGPLGRIALSRRADQLEAGWRFTDGTVAGLDQAIALMQDLATPDDLEDSPNRNPNFLLTPGLWIRWHMPVSLRWQPGVWIRWHMPESIRWQPGYLAMWQVIGIVMAIGALWLAYVVMHFLVDPIAAWLGNLSTRADRQRVRRGLRGLRFFIIVLLGYLMLPLLDLPVRAAGAIYTFDKFLLAFAIIWAGIGLADFIRLAAARRTESSRRKGFQDLIIPFMCRLFKIVLIVGALIYLISCFDEGALMGRFLAGLGVVGLAVSLAAQDSIKNLFATMLLFADKSFAVGDKVSIGNHEGTVEEVGFRSTRLRTRDDSVLILPNSTVAGGVIDNQAIRSHQRVAIQFHLDPESEPASLLEMQRRTHSLLSGQANVDVKRLEVGLQGVSDKGVELRAIAYVRGKGEAARSFRQEATLAMLSLARELGLKIMTEA